MTIRFPIVFEREASGVLSAYIAGLPVYAQGATQAQAERAIRATLAAYLEAHPEARSSVPPVIKIAAVDAGGRRPAIRIVSPAALIGGRTSRRKAASSRANGRLGGRPRKAAGRSSWRRRRGDDDDPEASATDAAWRNPARRIPEAKGITQVALAARMGIPLNRLNQVIRGKRNISADTALRLAKVLKTTPEFWMNLQMACDLYAAKRAMAAA